VDIGVVQWLREALFGIARISFVNFLAPLLVVALLVWFWRSLDKY
jgi:hypothetical protein